MSSQWMGQKGAEPPNAGQIPVVTSILKDFSSEALGQLRTWLEQNPPSIPVTQILGFSQFTGNVATVISTIETTASTSFTNLATVGPTLTGIPDGQYLFLYGCRAANNTAGSLAEMSIQVNATAAVSVDAAGSSTQVAMSVMRAVAKTLSNGGNNTVTAKYAANAAGTATFRERWLIALRYANA